MAAVCYQIYKSINGTDSQCADFAQFYNYTEMQIKPSVVAAVFANSGEFISLEFNQNMYKTGFTDCSNVFELSTVKWLPDSKSCKWSTVTTLQIDYNPDIGIMEQISIKSNSFYINNPYAQVSVDPITIPIKMPSFEASLRINSLSAISECDTLQLFGTITAQTLYPLTFKWNVFFEPKLPDSLIQEANEFFAPFLTYSQSSSMTVPSKFVIKGSRITATLYANYAKFPNLVVNATSSIRIYENIPKIKFTSKSAYLLKLDGSTTTRLPLQIDNFRCGTTDIIPIQVKFMIMSGNSPTEISSRGAPEMAIESKLANDYYKLKSLQVNRAQGFQYNVYYNITAVVQTLDTDSFNTDNIFIYFTKPPIKSVIDPPGTLVSIAFDVYLNGTNSEFPELESDEKGYFWKCISATSLAVGSTCQCPLLASTQITSMNLRLPKEKLVALCKYKFSLTVTATSGSTKRSSVSETEFITSELQAAPMKGKIVKGGNNELNDLYFTFGDTTAALDSTAKFNWTLTEVESLDPLISEKLSVKNTFIYDFFTNQYKANIDPAIKEADVIPTKTTRRNLADFEPQYVTPKTTQVLGVNQDNLMPFYKYTFAVTVLSSSTPNFLFITFTMPRAPRPRIFTVSPDTGKAFSTDFSFAFTLQASNEVDDAQYQLFRRNCPGSTNPLTQITQKMYKSNTYSTQLGPSLASCGFKVEIILRVYEFDSSIDGTAIVTIEESSEPLEQALSSQINQLETNKVMTLDQKISVLSEVSSVKVAESSGQSQEMSDKIVDQLSAFNITNGALDALSDKDKSALIQTVTETIASFTVSQMPNIDISKADQLSSQVDSYLTAIKTKEGNTYIIPTVLASFSGIAEIGTSKLTDSQFYEKMKEAIDSMSDMKFTEMMPGAVPYSISSPAIEMVIGKNYAQDYNNSKSFETKKGSSIDLPAGLSEQLLSNLNSTNSKSKVTFAASVSATSFNPFANIKSNTNISADSLSTDTLPGINVDTVKLIYKDLKTSKLNDLVNKKEVAADIIKLKMKPFSVSSDASENPINSNLIVGMLPYGKQAVMSIPFAKNISEFVNDTVMVPIYFDSEQEIWTNKNCSLDKPKITDKSLSMRCNHLGLSKNMTLNDGFVVSIDIIKNVFNVIKAGNYEQLTNVGALLEWNSRTQIVIPLDIALIIVLISSIILLTVRDRKDLYNERLRCLKRRFEPETVIYDTGCMHKVLAFFARLRKKGISKVSKKSQAQVHANKYVARKSIDQKTDPNAKKEKNKPANGFTKFTREDLQTLQEAYELLYQVKAIYDDDEVDEIMANELEKNLVLNRLTQALIQDSVLLEPITFWLLMKNEHPFLNAIFVPELTSPRPLKLLIFLCVLIGEFFVTGYFHDPNDDGSTTSNAASFIQVSIIYSIAANVLMIPLKIFISVFMTGTALNPEMTREQIESAERKAPVLRTIGEILGILWVIGCIYGITMFILSFSDYALNSWLACFGISVFTEIIVMTQLKVLFKVIIGMILMMFARSKAMLSAAGAVAGKVVDCIMSYL